MKAKIIFIAAVVATLTIVLGPKMFYAYGTVDTYVATVTDKERVVDPKSKDKGDKEQTTARYLVFTDVDTFEVTDTIWYLRFTSSTLYGKIKRDTKYRIKAYGWRFGPFNWYPNIISIQEVN